MFLNGDAYKFDIPIPVMQSNYFRHPRNYITCITVHNIALKFIYFKIYKATLVFEVGNKFNLDSKLIMLYRSFIFCL